MKYPKDRFDDIPPSIDRRGAHRAPRTRAAKIAAWLWGLGAIVVLVGLAVVGMLVVDRIVSGGGGTAESTPTPTETAPAEGQPAEPPAAVEPARNPDIPITVQNGTDQAGVASSADEQLTGLGWNVESTGDADNEDYATTIIYYGDAADEAAALALAQDLGGGTPTLDPARAPAGTITVIIGTDLA